MDAIYHCFNVLLHMTPEQFTYWLQGKLEGRKPNTITVDEIQQIQDHLNTVFHKITPTYTPIIQPTYTYPQKNPLDPPYTITC
jgi:hypothetical protein